jgi:transposase InsO family protein
LGQAVGRYRAVVVALGGARHVAFALAALQGVFPHKSRNPRLARALAVASQFGAHARVAPNRLAQRAPTSACDQVWQTDITYIDTAEGWLYLAVVLDAHSRRILGYAFSETLETDFVIQALLMAIVLRGGKLAPGLLLHSDRGVQYSSERFRAQLAAHGILPSMSRRGNCYDNAKAESFFSTLKLELVYRQGFKTRQQARLALFEWITAHYNLRRRHSSIGNLSPVDFENLTN